MEKLCVLEPRKKEELISDHTRGTRKLVSLATHLFNERHVAFCMEPCHLYNPLLELLDVLTSHFDIIDYIIRSNPNIHHRNSKEAKTFKHEQVTRYSECSSHSLLFPCDGSRVLDCLAKWMIRQQGGGYSRDGSDAMKSSRLHAKDNPGAQVRMPHAPLSPCSLGGCASVASVTPQRGMP